jgi:predicted transcriptional regulator
MEVHFTPEQEAQLSQLASHAGKQDAEHLVKDAALRLLEDARRFREGVERGIAAADRGEFVENNEVWANIEKILHS